MKRDTPFGPRPIPLSAGFLDTLISSSKYLSKLPYHVYTLYLFSCDNVKDIICMGLLFGMFNASIAPLFAMGPALGLGQIIQAMPWMLLWSWSNLFLFNLHNQRHSHAIAEDALNKPWRPLPAGRLTARQATKIMYCMYAVIITLGITVSALSPYLLEAVLCLWYNEWGSAADPVLKNILNGLSFACFFTGPFKVATRHSVFSGDGKAAIWLAILSGAITMCSYLQDFRDMDGDKATGRKTVPFVIGDMEARVLCVLGVSVLNSVACWFWGVGWRESAIAWIAGTLIALRILLDRSRQGDRFTWKLFPFWILGLLLFPCMKRDKMI